MRKVGVKNACFNFQWGRRSQKTDWFEELDFLSRLIIDHGFPLAEDVDLYDVDDYLDFLNDHEDLIEFAFDIPFGDDYIRKNTDVKIVPIFSRDKFDWLLDQDLVAVSRAQFDMPFFENYRRKITIHGYNMTKVPTNCYSFNSALWLYGSYGYTFWFNNKQLHMYNKKKSSYRSFVARKMIMEGYDLCYTDILKGDATEINLMNLYSWKSYADFCS